MKRKYLLLLVCLSLDILYTNVYARWYGHTDAILHARSMVHTSIFLLQLLVLVVHALVCPVPKRVSS